MTYADSSYLDTGGLLHYSYSYRYSLRVEIARNERTVRTRGYLAERLLGWRSRQISCFRYPWDDALIGVPSRRDEGFSQAIGSFIESTFQAARHMGSELGCSREARTCHMIFEDAFNTAMIGVNLDNKCTYGLRQVILNPRGISEMKQT